MTLQTNYDIRQGRGLAGQLAKPNAPYEYEQEKQVSVEVEPGDAVLYDRAAGKYKLPTTDAEELLISKIVTYDTAQVALNTGTIPTGGNSDAPIVYAADSVPKLAPRGVFYVVAGEAVSIDDPAIFDRATKKWIRYVPTVAITDGDTLEAALQTVAFEFASDATADGQITMVRVVGRVRP